MRLAGVLDDASRARSIASESVAVKYSSCEELSQWSTSASRGRAQDDKARSPGATRALGHLRGQLPPPRWPEARTVGMPGRGFSRDHASSAPNQRLTLTDIAGLLQKWHWNSYPSTGKETGIGRRWESCMISCHTGSCLVAHHENAFCTIG